MSSSSFLVACLGFSMNSIISSANSDSFTISFPSWIPFIYFYSPSAMARTSKTMLNKSGDGQFNSVAQSCLNLCDPMGSMSGFPVHHQLLELAQSHVHQVSDAIQPSCLCHPLLLLPSIFPSIRVFSNE